MSATNTPTERSSTEQAIGTLVRFAALGAHPDRPGGDVESMKRVNQAAEVLRRGWAPTHRPVHVERPAHRFLPWGKFKDESMAEVPLSYLGWLVDNIMDDPDTRDAARRWLHWRTR